jgi:branched-chain amino acid transport system ATP-binding protein
MSFWPISANIGVEAVLAVNDLEVRYGRLAAVRGVQLDVGKGEIVCVVGPNGAGKSTTLLTVAGELSPHAGTINFEGRPLTGLATENIVRQGISLVPEGRRIFGRLTVDENLRLATFIRPDTAEAAGDLEIIIEQFSLLRERRHAPAGRLSGGEQQILAITRALLTKPKLMLVDEPALGLAPLMVDMVYEVLTGLRDDGMTLLIVEQNLERALAVADRIYVLRDGRVQLTGRAEELRDGEQLEAAYFGFETQGAAS